MLEIFPLFCTLISEADGRMTAEERSNLVRLLEDTGAGFLGAVGQVDREAWEHKPGADRWSVAEIAEHILRSENSLFAAMRQALATKPSPVWRDLTAGKDEFLKRVLPNRDRAAEAPDIIKPKGGISREEILQEFADARARTLEFVRGTDVPLKAHIREHPFPVFGALNAYQWLLYIPFHNLRHNNQIEEVLQAL